MSDLVRFFVGNIGYNVTEQMLTAELARVGVAAQNVKIARDKQTNGPKGFAFIEVEAAYADRVIEKADGLQVGPKNLRVERAQSQPQDDRRPRRSDRPSPSVEHVRNSRGREMRADPADEDVWREDRRRSGGRRR